MSPDTLPTGPDDESDLEAGLYAFGLMEGHEFLRAAEREAHDPAFAAEVSAWRLRMAELDGTAEPVPANEALWQRIDGLIGGPSAPPEARHAQASGIESRQNAPEPSPGWFGWLWQSRPVWRATAFAGAAASVALAFVASSQPPSPVMIAVLLTDANRAAAVVGVYPDGRAQLLPLEPITVPDDRSLQVWTLWDRARGPVSLGILDRARQIRLPVENLPPTIPNQLFEITLEPKAGSPTGRPTGPILMKGTTSPTL